MTSVVSSAGTTGISIHALLAESDGHDPGGDRVCQGFLSTLSLRRATGIIDIINNVINDFYPRSPCGERQRAENHASNQQEFLSTLSLRRATVGQNRLRQKLAISIHALLAESDDGFITSRQLPTTFLSTLSLRRATLIRYRIKAR